MARQKGTKAPASGHHIRTLKLKLRVVNEDRKAAWKRLRQISNDAWKAANWIASGQYLNDQLVRRIYARRKVDPKDRDAVSKVEEDLRALVGTKRQATTERDIKRKFPELPSCVTNTLNQIVYASYRTEKDAMRKGLRSLRTYRMGMPVPTKKASIEIARANGTHRIAWKLGAKERLQFEILYGRDAANNQLTVERILEGSNDYSAALIQLNDKGLFLLLPVKEPQEQHDLDADLAVGIDLGLAVPAYAALSTGPARMMIGHRDDFLKLRMQMQARRRRIQRGLVVARAGHGRKRRLKALDRLREKERHFARSYNHLISRKVVDFAIRHRAGSIKMEMLEGFGQNERNAFVLRNWSYFELQRLIGEKAKRAGVEVQYVDPYHTSQTCSACGHHEQGQRVSQAEFCCKQCGVTMHADYNAALNIANSDKIVTRKEECQLYRQTASKGKTKDETAGPTAEG